MNTKFSAVVAAAGLSSRMNDFKQLMHIGPASLAERVVKTLVGFGADPVVAIIGYRADDLSPVLESAGATCVLNENYASTEMFDSIKIGFNAIPNECNRVFFSPADVPLFTESDLMQIASIKSEVVIPSYSGKGGHPVLMSSSLIPQLLAYDGDGGLKGFFKSLPRNSVSYAEVKNMGVLMDANYPDDFSKLEAFYESKFRH